MDVHQPGGEKFKMPDAFAEIRREIQQGPPENAGTYEIKGCGGINLRRAYQLQDRRAV